MDGRAQYQLAASLWVIAGFAFPLLTPATNLLSREPQHAVLAAVVGALGGWVV